MQELENQNDGPHIAGLENAQMHANDFAFQLTFQP